MGFAGGQILDISLGHRDYVIQTRRDFRDVQVVISEGRNASIYRDVEWSFRRKGEAKLTKVPYKGVGRVDTTGFPGSVDAEYEFVITCTGGTYTKEHFWIKVEGVWV